MSQVGETTYLFWQIQQEHPDGWRPYGFGRYQDNRRIIEAQKECLAKTGKRGFFDYWLASGVLGLVCRDMPGCNWRLVCVVETTWIYLHMEGEPHGSS